MMILLRLTYAFVLTVLIEGGVLWGLYEKRKEIIRLSVLLNILTNIPLNVFNIYSSFDIWQILVAEICIVMIEACGYFMLLKNCRISIVYSLLCNTMSFFLGVLFEYVYLLCTKHYFF